MPSTGLFQKPFPAMRSGRKAPVSAFGFGAFVAGFLFVFKPFGLHAVPTGLGLVCLSYGGITTGVMLFMQLLWPRFFPTFYAEEGWTVGKEITHTMANIVLIAAGNLAYTHAKGFIALSAGNYLVFLGITLVVGSFPVVVGVLLRQNAYQRKYLAQSQRYNSQLDRQQQPVPAAGLEVEEVPASAKIDKSISLQEEAGGKVFRCLASELLALEAADNYIKLHLHQTDNQEAPFRKTELLRLSLNAAEKALAHHKAYFRCHRSWLVKLDALEKVEGNARGYRLHLQGMKEPVPVSRSRIEAFQERMEKTA